MQVDLNSDDFRCQGCNWWGKMEVQGFTQVLNRFTPRLALIFPQTPGLNR